MLNDQTDSEESENPNRLLTMMERREIKELLLALPPTRAPGLDSFTGELYQILMK